jgi:glutamyl/glutaminyl-tRNA synthetase
MMEKIKQVIEGIDPFNSKNTEETVKKFIEENALGFGAVLNPFRLCLVGAAKGPHLFDIIEIIGKEEVIKRIEGAIHNIKNK